MDIPKFPGLVSDNTTAQTNSKGSIELVSIDSLSLTQAKTYSAKVIGAYQSVIQNNDTTNQAPTQTSTQSPQTNANPTQSIPNPATSAMPDKQWLLQLNGKTLLIETAIPLKQNQLISVKYDNQIGLLITPPKNITSPSNMQAPSTTSLLNNAELNIVLKAMGQVMSRQVSLDKGFSELLARAFPTENAAHTKAAHDTSLPPTALTTQSTLLALLKNLPLKQQFLAANLPSNTNATKLATNNTSAQVAGQQSDANTTHSAKIETPISPALRPGNTSAINALVNALKSSGLFFESSLLSSHHAPQHLNAQFNSTQALVKNIATLLQQTQSVASNEANKNPTTISPATPPIATPRSDQGAPATVNALLEQVKSGLQQLPPNPGQTSIANDGTTLSQQVNPSTLKSTINKLSSEIGNLITKAAGQNPDPKQASTTENMLHTSLTTASLTTVSLKNDLKSALLALSAALTDNSKAPTDTTKSYVDGLTQTSLLNSPFDFPHLGQQNLMKANAILADRELSTGQLLKLLAGMLNRVQFNQLNSLYQSQSNSNEALNNQSWFFELPVIAENNQVNTFHMRLDREEEKNDKNKPNAKQKIQWRIALSFDLDELGPIYIQVNLSPPSISSMLWAHNPKTHQMINNERGYFRDQLQSLGLEVGDILCQQGQPKHNKAKLDRSLVDIKA